MPDSIARTGANVSPVTQPAQISSHRACFSSSPGLSASWRKKYAPASPSVAMIARCVSVNSISVGAASVNGADRRGGRRSSHLIQPPPIWPDAGPGDLTGGQQLVEHRRLVVAHPLSEHQRLDRRGRNRHPGQLIDHRGQPVDTRVVRRPDLLPGRQEAAVGGGADGLDLRPQRGQRAAPQDLQNVGVTPLFAVGSGR